MKHKLQTNRTVTNRTPKFRIIQLSQTKQNIKYSVTYLSEAEHQTHTNRAFTNTAPDTILSELSQAKSCTDMALKS